MSREELIRYLHWNERMIREFNEQGDIESARRCKFAYDDLCFQIAEFDSGKKILSTVVYYDPHKSPESAFGTGKFKRKGVYR